MNKKIAIITLVLIILHVVTFATTSLAQDLTD